MSRPSDFLTARDIHLLCGFSNACRWKQIEAIHIETNTTPTHIIRTTYGLLKANLRVEVVLVF